MTGRWPVGLRQVGLLLVTALLCVPSSASEYRVRAYIEPRDNITDLQPIRLVIQVEGGRSPEVRPPRLTELTNLSVVSGPNHKMHTSWIDGRTSSTVELSYTLLPEKAGPASIPALTIDVAGETHQTPAFDFKVIASRGGAPEPRGERSGRRAADDESDLVFLEAKLGTDEVWVGQPVPLTVILYTQPRVTGFAWRKQPDFANFWVEPVDFDADAESYRTRISGKIYQAFPVDRRILIPPGPGEYELEPYVGQVQVRVSRDDPFDWFRFGRSESVLRKSKPLTLTVRELPAATRPADFSGAVGRYEMNVSVDREEARVDDAVALVATVEGEGSLRSVDPPQLDAPTDLKLFDPQVKESIVRSEQGKVFSRKTWEWILVPMSPGDVRLPDVRFDYFDPESATYVSATGDPIVLTVRRGDPTDEPSLARGGIRVQRKELAFIKPLRGELRAESERAHQKNLFRMLAILPLALTPLAIFVGRHRARLRRDHGLARSRSARSRARKRLQAARKQLDRADGTAFHEELARALVDYLADRTNRSSSGLSYDLAEDLLAAEGVDPDLRRRFRKCLETCDFVRFVPEASKTERRLETLEEASDLVEQLERAW